MQFKEFALNPEEYLDESTIQLLCSYGLNREDIVNSICNGVKESKITIDTLKLIDRIYGYTGQEDGFYKWLDTKQQEQQRKL